MGISTKFSALLPLLLVLALGTTAHLAHRASLAAWERSRVDDGVPRLFVPDAAFLRKISLGQRTALSDLYWLQLIQYVGTKEADAAGWPQLAAIGNLVVDLDPEHGYAYEVVGLLLASKGRIEESNAILGKGMENVPDRWQLPFFAGFNHFFELQDPLRGGELIARASRIPGAPEYLPHLAARLLNTGGRIDTAIAFVEAALAEAGDNEAARAALEQRRDQLRIEQALQLIEQAIARYEERTGRKPASLDELVGSVLVGIPTAPSGVPFAYDPATGALSHPELPERIVYRDDLVVIPGSSVPSASTEATP